MTYESGIEAYVAFARQAAGGLAGLKGLTLADRRTRADRYAELVREPYPGTLSVRDTYMVLPGRELFARIYRPDDVPGPLATVLYFHGGSFVAGSPQGHDFITASLAHHANVQVISVHYRRAPETPYPGPTEDCYAALCWTAEHADMLGVDVHRLGVAGDSAGGNLAAACALLARDRAGPALRIQALIYPTLDDDLDSPSYLNNTQDAFLTREAMEFAIDAFLPKGVPRDDGYALPMRARSHRDLPTTYIVVADHDPLMDDGRRYAEKLKLADVDVTLQVAPGAIHGFLRARRYSAMAESQCQLLCTALRNSMDRPAPRVPW